MKKLNILKKELEDLVLNDRPYKEIIEKSKEIDFYITKETLKISKIKIEY